MLGSLGYDMAVHADYRAVQDEVRDKDVRLIAIHDDLTIVGPAPAAFAAFDMFARRLSARGDLTNVVSSSLPLTASSLTPSLNRPNPAVCQLFWEP